MLLAVVSLVGDLGVGAASASRVFFFLRSDPNVGIGADIGGWRRAFALHVLVRTVRRREDQTCRQTQTVHSTWSAELLIADVAGLRNGSPGRSGWEILGAIEARRLD